MKNIPNFPNYCITKDGRVWSKPRCGTGCSEKGRWIKSTKSSAGYLAVGLYKNRKNHYKLIHRLVLETYVDLCPKGMEACHNDGNKQNCNLSNLRWDTRSNNHYDAVKHGTIIGEKRYNHKLTITDAKMIVYIYRTKQFLMQEIADIYSISKGLVWQIIHKKAWKHIWAEKKELNI